MPVGVMELDLGPFNNRPEEWKLYCPLVGNTMLELGNKRNGLYTYKNFFQRLGYQHISVDWNGEDGAMKLDLRQPLQLGVFDMVSNIGTTEHISEQEPVWRNILEAMHVGSVLVSTTPAPGHWPRHGSFYPMAKFFLQLASRNGLVLERLYKYEEIGPQHHMWYARLRRETAMQFTMPDNETIYRNAA